MHSLLIARGDDILLNAYWKPFTRETLHRQNSVTKSFVALAIGLLIDEGRVALSDRLVDFFPECLSSELDPERATLTVEDALKMRTSYVATGGGHWVRDRKYGRIKSFFTETAVKLNDSMFYYDSTGSYILGCIVERLTGMPFMEYLKEKLLLKLGFSDRATCIKGGEGYSWSDSGLLCTAEDLYKVGKFIKNGGVHNGEQLLSADFLRRAVSPLSSTDENGADTYGSHGYGYQIWCESFGGFGFHGMGAQFMFCCPEKDVYVVCNADTQDSNNGRIILCDMIRDFIEELGADEPLDEDRAAFKSLSATVKGLKLASMPAGVESEFAASINGARIMLAENPMGIEWLTLDLDRSVLKYKNAQGEKAILFDIGRNAFSEFPENGYFDMEIGVDGHCNYPIATSAAWLEDRLFAIKVQFIGKHLGGLYIRLGFTTDGRVAVSFKKTTNCFLDTYNGNATGSLLLREKGDHEVVDEE